MNQPANAQEQAKITTANLVEIFDPPMCCPTGLCGPVLDQTLLDVNEMIFALQSKGFEVRRYQMASDPNAFLNNDGSDAPGPRTADGRPARHRGKRHHHQTGGYPSLAEVEKALSEKAS